MAAVAKRRGWPILRFDSRRGVGLRRQLRTLAGFGSLFPVGAGAVGIGVLTRNRRRGVNFFTSTFSQMLLATTGVQLNVIGEENLNAQRPAVFIYNHRNQVDPVIAGALVIGLALRLGDDLLEVPISAMLIFSSAGPHAAASGRVIDTLIGAAAGLVGGVLLVGGPRVQPASSAVGRLAGAVSGLMDQMAHDLAHEPPDDDTREDDLSGVAKQWLGQARTLRDEIDRVEDTLRDAADSARLNPHRFVAPADAAQATETTVALRSALEALEHATLTLRGLTRSVLDSAGIANEASPIRDAYTRKQLANVLGKLAGAIRTYERLVRATPAADEALESALTADFDEAHQLQDELADLLKPQVGDGGEPSEWPLRGEILNHVDRLRTGLSVEAVDALARVRRSSRPKLRRHSRPRPLSRPGAGSRSSRSSRRASTRPRTGSRYK